MSRLPLFLRHCLAATAFAAGLTINLTAAAAPLQDAQQLIRQGQYAQALEQVDKHLADKPKDAQGRFLRGVILTEMGKTNDAISVFTKLTDDYPELPEPYNNLAVIYAQQKQYEKAKQALEKAIRTHPAYATAHENLGDIYARMASQAYDKALQLDSSNTIAQTKLSMMRDLISVSSRTAATPVTPPIAAPVAVVAAASRPVPVAAISPPAVPVATPSSASEIPRDKSGTKTNSAAANPPASAPVAATKAVEKPADKPAEKAPSAAEAEIGRAVEAWATAWSKKDVKAYLSHYAKDFRTPGGSSRSAWETEREQRIRKPGGIKVTIEGIKISEGSEQTTVRFRQRYESASLKSSSPKTLVMVKRDGKWLIQQERVGG
jgi:tetratricopeptide (TPR) repeat protein